MSSLSLLTVTELLRVDTEPISPSPSRFSLQTVSIGSKLKIKIWDVPLVIEAHPTITRRIEETIAIFFTVIPSICLKIIYITK